MAKAHPRNGRGGRGATHQGTAQARVLPVVKETKTHLAGDGGKREAAARGAQLSHSPSTAHSGLEREEGSRL